MEICGSPCSDTNCYIPTYDCIEIQRYTRITIEIGDWVVEESEFGNGISRALGGEQDELGEEEGYCLIHFLVDASSVPSRAFIFTSPSVDQLGRAHVPTPTAKAQSVVHTGCYT